MNKDLFSQGLGYLNTAPIDLRKINIPPYQLGREFSKTVIVPNRPNWIKEAIEPIARKLSTHRHPDGLRTGIYEAMLNAYQHGNKEDPAKPIILADHVTSEKARIAIIDHGGVLDPAMASYILHQRQSSPVPDFYTFSGKKRPGQNNGTGTKFLHIYFDKVHYFKAPKAGLGVLLERMKSIGHS
jgi:anti-sigma regulatory factor (Ser/Thr protein kinase)